MTEEKPKATPGYLEIIVITTLIVLGAIWGYDQFLAQKDPAWSDPQQFDLILTDQTMPGLSGSQLAKAVLEVSQN